MGGDDTTGPAGGAPPPERPWQHPSEVGRQLRVEADHRRSHKLVFAVVGLGAGLAVAAALLPVLARDDAPESAAVEEQATFVRIEPLDDTATLTGIVMDDDGHVLVPMAALAGGDDTEVRVQCAGAYLDAEVVATDSHSDMAVVHIDPTRGTPASAAVAQEGDTVRLVTHDSGGRRQVQQVDVTSTDAEELRANGTIASGVLVVAGATATHGVLVDDDDKVVGWVFDRGPGVDGAAAYPAAAAMEMARDMVRRRSTTHSWIGVRVAPEGSTDGTADGPGVALVGVQPGGPAAEAGLAAGDRLVSIDDEPLGTVADLVEWMDRTPPGTLLRVGVLRGGATYSFDITTVGYPG